MSDKQPQHDVLRIKKNSEREIAYYSISDQDMAARDQRVKRKRRRISLLLVANLVVIVFSIIMFAFLYKEEETTCSIGGYRLSLFTTPSSQGYIPSLTVQKTAERPIAENASISIRFFIPDRSTVESHHTFILLPELIENTVTAKFSSVPGDKMAKAEIMVDKTRRVLSIKLK